MGLVSRLLSSMKRERGDDAGGEEARRKKEEASSRLIWVCQDGDVVAARQAIADDANVDVPDEHGWFPLLYAALPEYGNSLEIVKMLIDAGCDVNQVDSDGWTALNWAVSSGGKVRILEALLRAGANPNIANPC